MPMPRMPFMFGRRPSIGGSRMPPELENSKELQEELARLGVRIPAPRQHMLFPEPGTDNFFGRHPGVTRAIEGAGLGLAAYQSTGGSAANQVADATRAALVGGPMLRTEMENARIQGPLQLGLQVAQLKRQREQDELYKTHADLYKQQATHSMWLEKQDPVERQQVLADGKILQTHRSGKTSLAMMPAKEGETPMPAMGLVKESPDKYGSPMIDPSGGVWRPNTTEGTLTPFTSPEGPLPAFRAPGGTSGTLEERIDALKQSSDPTDQTTGRRLEAAHQANLTLAAGGRAGATKQVALPYEIYNNSVRTLESEITKTEGMDLPPQIPGNPNATPSERRKLLADNVRKELAEYQTYAQELLRGGKLDQVISHEQWRMARRKVMPGMAPAPSAKPKSKVSRWDR